MIFHNVSLDVRDLTSLHPTGRTVPNGESQVYIGDSYSTVCAYVTADGALAVANAWLALADKLHTAAEQAAVYSLDIPA